MSANSSLFQLRYSFAWSLFYLLAFVCFYYWSFYLLTFNTEGDQFFYTRFYYSLIDAPYLELPFIQKSLIGSAEPGYAILAWISVNLGIDKIYFISIMNSFLAVFTAATIRRLGGDVLIILFVFTNFYFIILLTGAERLKFSYLALVMGITIGGRFGSILMLSMPFFHFQSLINFASIFAGRQFNLLQVKDLSKSKRNRQILVSIAMLLCFIVFMNHLGAKVFAKAIGYITNHEAFSDISNILILFVFALIISKNKGEAIAQFVPIIIAGIVIGGARVNMIGAIMLFYTALKYNRKYHPIMIILYIYFSYKSLDYIHRIINYGTGF